MSEVQQQAETGPVTVRVPKGTRFALCTCALVLFVGMLYVARDFFLPLVLAFLIALTLSPIVRAGRRRGVPPSSRRWSWSSACR